MKFPYIPNSLLVEYFRANHKHLKTYINVGTIAAKCVIAPVGMLLKHLIKIQGLDPNAEPGHRTRELFQQAINDLFTKTHTEDFSPDFDFSWRNKKFQEVQNNSELDLSKNDFTELTDISHLQSVAPETINVTTVPTNRTPVQELADLLEVHPVNSGISEPVKPTCYTVDEESWLKMHGDVHANPPRLNLPKPKEYKSGDTNAVSLKDALKSLAELDQSSSTDEIINTVKKLSDVMRSARKDFENEEEYTQKVKELTRLFKKEEQMTTSSLSRVKKKGKVHRTPTRKTGAVKKISPKPSLQFVQFGDPAKEADAIQKLIKVGRLEPADLDLLVQEGLDPRAVKAWKRKYGKTKVGVPQPDPKFKGMFRRSIK